MLARAGLVPNAGEDEAVMEVRPATAKTFDDLDGRSRWRWLRRRAVEAVEGGRGGRGGRRWSRWSTAAKVGGGRGELEGGRMDCGGHGMLHQ